jgi:hypothetical protein
MGWIEDLMKPKRPLDLHGACRDVASQTFFDGFQPPSHGVPADPQRGRGS